MPGLHERERLSAEALAEVEGPAYVRWPSPEA